MQDLIANVIALEPFANDKAIEDFSVDAWKRAQISMGFFIKISPDIFTTVCFIHFMEFSDGGTDDR